jgi:hypothetical protein
MANRMRCLQNSPVKIQTPTHLEHDRPQQDNPAVRVIAQQYASITFISLSFLFSTEIFSGLFKNIVFLNCLFIIKIYKFKLPNFKVHKSGVSVV